MKLIQVLLLLALLGVTPSVVLAQDVTASDLERRRVAPIPEASGALVMGVALAALALLIGRKRE
jgi:hypothetical protein